jgi:hypothetical protein
LFFKFIAVFLSCHGISPCVFNAIMIQGIFPSLLGGYIESAFKTIKISIVGNENEASCLWISQSLSLLAESKAWV